VASAWEEELAPAIPRVWRSEVEDLRSDLRGWVQQLVSATDGWDPVHAEFGFGMPPESSRDPASSASEAELAGGVRLRGSIDWVESHSGRNTLRVTDHKTGKPPEFYPKYTGGGAAVQPLAYALAAEKLLGRTVEAGRLWYCSARGEYRQIAIAVTPESRRALSRLFEIVDREIERGFLPAAPRTQACAFCDYRAVCGPHEEQRVLRKSPTELAGLHELRMLP
jgi:CRISPR/Cas system-associated exonuclease Cas4 (RecB family)